MPDALRVTSQTYEKASILFNLLCVQSHCLLTNNDLFTLTTALIAYYASIAYHVVTLVGIITRTINCIVFNCHECVLPVLCGSSVPYPRRAVISARFLSSITSH